MWTHGDSDLKPILAAMQQTLTSIDGKMDALMYRMDCMSEHLGKHAYRLDGAERRISEIKAIQADGQAMQKKLDQQLATLQARDLEAQSKWDNLRSV
ncbi:hypothetical protein NDU88_004313 [Pleurodeles waltl]|uniref:Uncharacterized protein n=1 Tax=Pleurodeles waltl TaxID=8319 RepID=A0AAV7WRH8_PLEWA|nr:hypothetical protein NDU88_004313 [Pleurodeles waltl]